MVKHTVSIRSFFTMWFFQCVARATEPRQWNYVRRVVESQPFMRDVTLIVGDATGRLFHHDKGDMTLDRPLWVASASKMVFVVRAMQMVEKGFIQLNEPVSTYLPYWSKDASDSRSRVTLFHLLSFQSGYTFGLNQMDSCWLKPWTNFSSCVERLYHILPHSAEPGSVWDNEFHNQVVAAVLEKVLGKGLASVLSEDLISWNMTHSKYVNHEGPGGPDVSADLVTTARDYEQFMFRYFGGSLLSNTTVSFMEEDHMPKRCSLASLPLVVPQGHYGIGNWWVCANDVYPVLHGTQLHPLPKRCVDAQVHSDQGLFGFWPVWDRRLGYWMLLAAEGLPGISDGKAELLQQVLKPFIDRAVQQDTEFIAEAQEIDWDEVEAVWHRQLDSANARPTAVLV